MNIPPHTAGSYSRLIQKAHTAGSYSRLIQKAHTAGSYRRLIQQAHTEGSYSRLIQQAHTEGSYRRLIQQAHTEGSYSRLIQVSGRELGPALPPPAVPEFGELEVLASAPGWAGPTLQEIATNARRFGWAAATAATLEVEWRLHQNKLAPRNPKALNRTIAALLRRAMPRTGAAQRRMRTGRRTSPSGPPSRRPRLPPPSHRRQTAAAVGHTPCQQPRPPQTRHDTLDAVQPADLAHMISHPEHPGRLRRLRRHPPKPWW